MLLQEHKAQAAASQAVVDRQAERSAVVAAQINDREVSFTHMKQAAAQHASQIAGLQAKVGTCAGTASGHSSNSRASFTSTF